MNEFCRYLRVFLLPVCRYVSLMGFLIGRLFAEQLDCIMSSEVPPGERSLIISSPPLSYFDCVRGTLFSSIFRSPGLDFNEKWNFYDAFAGDRVRAQIETPHSPQHFREDLKIELIHTMEMLQTCQMFLHPFHLPTFWLNFVSNWISFASFGGWKMKCS